MHDDIGTFVVQRNGRAATAAQLAPLAFAGYAHFTAMQVRAGKVRGLDLHLQRLRLASVEMFGQALPDEQIRAYLRSALDGAPPDLSLTATVYSPAGEFTAAGADVAPEVLVRTAPPSSGPAGPLSLDVAEHERMLPAVKHVGEVAKTYLLRRAVANGFDDALFIDRRGYFSEGTIWNLAFWDDGTVVWPDAPMLHGTTMGILQRQLRLLDIPQRVAAIGPAELARLGGAVVMNSWTPAVPVRRVGALALPAAPEFVELLHRAYAAEPPCAP